MADQASGNNEVHIHLRLKQTDAKILQAIDEALRAHRKGHVRHLPRLRRADRRGPAERHSLDAGVHHLQGEAEGVTPTELQQLLREFYLERLALLMRHEAAARLVTDYDVNNAYQYIISREETHVSWLQHALLDVGAAFPPTRRARRQAAAQGRRRRARARRRRRARQSAVRRQVARPRRAGHQRPPQGHAAGHPRRDARAPAALRAGRRRAAPTSSARRWPSTSAAARCSTPAGLSRRCRRRRSPLVRVAIASAATSAIASRTSTFAVERLRAAPQRPRASPRSRDRAGRRRRRSRAFSTAPSSARPPRPRARCSTRCSPSSARADASGRIQGAPRTLDLDLILYGGRRDRRARAAACRIRDFASARSCWSRWRRSRRDWLRSGHGQVDGGAAAAELRAAACSDAIAADAARTRAQPA